MKEGLESKMLEANKLFDAGQFDSAKNIYLELTKQDPQSVRILAGLGLVCMEIHALDEAVGVFRRAVELAPALESVSKGLFHSLWKLERRVEAMEEVKRFQSISDSEDYQEIIKEINEKCA